MPWQWSRTWIPGEGDDESVHCLVAQEGGQVCRCCQLFWPKDTDLPGTVAACKHVEKENLPHVAASDEVAVNDAALKDDGEAAGCEASSVKELGPTREAGEQLTSLSKENGSAPSATATPASVGPESESSVVPGPAAPGPDVAPAPLAPAAAREAPAVEPSAAPLTAPDAPAAPAEAPAAPAEALVPAPADAPVPAPADAPVPAPADALVPAPADVSTAPAVAPAAIPTEPAADCTLAAAPAALNSPPSSPTAELQLLLSRQADAPLPFSCKPSTTMAGVKEQLGLPQISSLTDVDGRAYHDAATVAQEGLRDGDTVYFKASASGGGEASTVPPPVAPSVDPKPAPSNPPRLVSSAQMAIELAPPGSEPEQEPSLVPEASPPPPPGVMCNLPPLAAPDPSSESAEPPCPPSLDLALAVAPMRSHEDGVRLGEVEEVAEESMLRDEAPTTPTPATTAGSVSSAWPEGSAPRGASPRADQLLPLRLLYTGTGTPPRDFLAPVSATIAAVKQQLELPLAVSLSLAGQDPFAAELTVGSAGLRAHDELYAHFSVDDDNDGDDAAPEAGPEPTQSFDDKADTLGDPGATDTANGEVGPRESTSDDCDNKSKPDGWLGPRFGMRMPEITAWTPQRLAWMTSHPYAWQFGLKGANWPPSTALPRKRQAPSHEASWSPPAQRAGSQPSATRAQPLSLPSSPPLSQRTPPPPSQLTPPPAPPPIAPPTAPPPPPLGSQQLPPVQLPRARGAPSPSATHAPVRVPRLEPLDRPASPPSSADDSVSLPVAKSRSPAKSPISNSPSPLLQRPAEAANWFAPSPVMSTRRLSPLPPSD